MLFKDVLLTEDVSPKPDNAIHLCNLNDLDQYIKKPPTPCANDNDSIIEIKEEIKYAISDFNNDIENYWSMFGFCDKLDIVRLQDVFVKNIIIRPIECDTDEEQASTIEDDLQEY